jgi:uncharacterized protein DUF4743
LSYLDRIAECSAFDPATYVPFVVADHPVGLIAKSFVPELTAYPTVFSVRAEGVWLHSKLLDFDSRTEAMHGALLDLRECGHVPRWCDEAFSVGVSFSTPPLFKMERGAVGRFGVHAYGVHLNGFVRDGDEIHMWIARRSHDREMDPGKLDQIVAGGQPAGLTLRQNLIKECAEEAAIPQFMAEKAIGVGAVSYRFERPEGLRRDVEFVYDLELPDDFTPRNTDGEVEAFELWPLEKVAQTVRETTAFKFNCNLVIIDFLIRHGFIEPDHPEYSDLIHGLRSGQHVPGLSIGCA